MPPSPRPKSPKPSAGAASRKKPSGTPSPAAKSSSRWTLIGGLAILVLMAMTWVALLKPMNASSNSKMLQIKSGQTYSGLISYLSQHHMVHFAWIIKIYQHLFIHHTLKAGVYEIPAGVNAYRLLNLLNSGELMQMNRIMLVEGMSFQQLKDRLAANTEVKNTVLSRADADIMTAAGIPLIHPEGWFAPDTYFFNPGESDTVILKQLFEKQKKIMTAEWATRAPNLPYHNMNDALIMASIVEKETGVDGERAKVAAVFLNRLKVGMRLQTDPTVIYGMGDRYDGRISKADLETPTPYNTYVINGMPPTPIAMPGLAAIHAALHPADIDALYFVATGTGGHTFSKTLDEHNAAVQHYLQVMRAKNAANS